MQEAGIPGAFILSYYTFVDKYKKSTGIHLLSGNKIKIELNRRFRLNASRALVTRWYAGLIGAIVYSAKGGCEIEKLCQMICDETVLEGTKVISHTKNQALIQNEIPRRYKLYAFLIKCRMPRLLRVVARVL